MGLGHRGVADDHALTAGDVGVVDRVPPDHPAALDGADPPIAEVERGPGRKCRREPAAGDRGPDVLGPVREAFRLHRGDDRRSIGEGYR